MRALATKTDGWKISDLIVAAFITAAATVMVPFVAKWLDEEENVAPIPPGPDEDQDDPPPPPIVPDEDDTPPLPDNSKVPDPPPIPFEQEPFVEEVSFVAGVQTVCGNLRINANPEYDPSSREYGMVTIYMPDGTTTVHNLSRNSPTVIAPGCTVMDAELRRIRLKDPYIVLKISWEGRE